MQSTSKGKLTISSRPTPFKHRQQELAAAVAAAAALAAGWRSGGHQPMEMEQEELLRARVAALEAETGRQGEEIARLLKKVG